MTRNSAIVASVQAKIHNQRLPTTMLFDVRQQPKSLARLPQDVRSTVGKGSSQEGATSKAGETAWAQRDS